MKKNLLCLVISLITLKASYSQTKGDTLSLANYTQKASMAMQYVDHSITSANSTDLNSKQKDSVTEIFKSYFLQILKLKTLNPGPSQKMQLLSQYKLMLETRIRKVLSFQQYALLVQTREIERQKLSQKMDSVYKIQHHQ